MKRFAVFTGAETGEKIAVRSSSIEEVYQNEGKVEISFCDAGAEECIYVITEGFSMALNEIESCIEE